MNADELKHYGIKGQKWGRRRYQNKDGSLTPEGRERYSDSIADTKVYTKKGVAVTLRHQPTPLISKIIGKLSKSAQTNAARSDFVNITVDGKKVGDLQLYKESPKSINVVWVSIDQKYEGNGYGSTVMRAVADHARKQNMDRVTLEVPGISPNARHIYESIGFKAAGKVSDEDDAWGGLTAMVLDLTEERRVKHYALGGDEMNADELKHYGIKGQKWGRRRYQNKDGSLTPEGKKRYGDISEDEFNAKYKAENLADMKNTKKSLDAGQKDADAMGKLSEKKRNKRQAEVDAATEAAIREHVYKMSDDDLRAAVNRINMEERYAQVMQQREHIEVGKTKTEKFMSAASTTLTLTSTALTIAMMIRELQK